MVIRLASFGGALQLSVHSTGSFAKIKAHCSMYRIGLDCTGKAVRAEAVEPFTGRHTDGSPD